METPDRSGDTTSRLRRLRGVSWEWREGAPVESDGREAGVIAQEVQAVFPELVKPRAHGYLTVNYRGLAEKIEEAVIELWDRVARIEACDVESRLSDADVKRHVDPVEGALGRLGSGEGLERADYTALVGALVEAIKELDARLLDLERRGMK